MSDKKGAVYNQVSGPNPFIDGTSFSSKGFIDELICLMKMREITEVEAKMVQHIFDHADTQHTLRRIGAAFINILPTGFMLLLLWMGII